MKEKIKRLLKLNEELHMFSCNIKQTANPNNSDMAALIISYFLKARKTHSAIIILAKQDFGEDSLILTRSLFEMVVTLKYILSDESGERYLRWRDHDWIDRERILDAVKSKEKSLVDHVKSEAEKANEKYKYNRYDWSDKSIKRMAEDKDVGLFEKWQTLYNMQCSMSHNAPRSVHHFLTVKRDSNIELTKSKTDYEYIENSLVAGFENFLLIMDIFAKEFSLNITNDFESSVKELVDIINTS